MKYLTALSALLLVGTAGCSRQMDTTQAQKQPTATETFNLRSKCVELAEKLDRDMSHAPEVIRETTSNYNSKNNRCYVTFEEHPGPDSMSTVQGYQYVMLYDGQTRDVLAFTKVVGGAANDPASTKSGMVFGKNIPDYDAAGNYIHKMMEREGEQ